MKVPLPRGAMIDMPRMDSWASAFAGYRHVVNEQRIDRWLKQFAQKHQDIAARILDCVDFVSQEQMAAAFRSILNQLSGWNIDPNKRNGQWRFVAFSSSSGESGDSMLHKFRLANRLNFKKYDRLFIHRSELLQVQFGPDDNIVFVDDFAGTGRQACLAWSDSIQELLPGDPSTYLVLVAASKIARDNINQNTNLTVYPSIELWEDDNIFSLKCKHFSPAEKKIILSYCMRADSKNPKGFGDCGFVIVLANNCPNDSIPILHRHKSSWEGLFRRND